MNRLVLLFALMMISGLSSLHAQDLAIYDISITSDTAHEVPLGVFTAVEVSITNADTSSIPFTPGDTLDLGVNLYGYSFDTALVLASGLVPGDSMNFNFGPDKLAFINGTLPFFSALAVLSYGPDSNTLNNGVEVNYIVSDSVNNDWSCTDISISPTELLVFDLDNGTNIPPAISNMEVHLENVGDVNYIAGTRMNYSIYQGAQNFSLNIQVESNVDLGGEVVRNITNQAVLPSIPAEEGTYQLCAASNAASDLDVNNDGFCIDILVVDNFDPSDPLNWPTSVENVEEEHGLSFIADGKQMVFQSSENQQLEIYNMQGALIRSQRVNGGEQLLIHDLESGIYVLQARSDGQLIQRKFAIAQ